MNQIYYGDCLDILRREVPNAAVNLILTSPPYANQRKRSYGGIASKEYVAWFLRRAEEFKRVLKADGSLILNICPHSEKGEEAAYVADLVAALRETWYLKDTYAWRKTNPTPRAVTSTLKNGWEPCFHFSLSRKPAFYPEEVKRPAKPASIERANRLSVDDLKRRKSATGSGFGINMGGMAGNYYERKYRQTNSGVNFADTPYSFCDDDYMAYPDNVIECACEGRNLQKTYGDPRYDDNPMASACYPERLVQFFIDLFTRKGDTVMDPFSGSGTTVFVAQRSDRNAIAIEKEPANIHLIVNRLSNRRRSSIGQKCG